MTDNAQKKYLEKVENSDVYTISNKIKLTWKVISEHWW